MPKMSCLVVSHNKPDFINEAIWTITIQDMPDWEAIVIDSGVLYDQGFFDKSEWKNDSRIQVLRSGETPELRTHKAMAPWCFNECFRRGLVKGEWVMYLCDDDVFYPHAFSTFMSFAEQNPKAEALYASQDVGAIWPDGRKALIGERRAQGMAGEACRGRRLDCQVDYLQFCHKRNILERFGHNEYWPEALHEGHHADGLFMERIGRLVPIYPIDIKVSCNRRTPVSINGRTT